MKRARLDLLIRTWLEMLMRGDEADVAATAASALKLQVDLEGGTIDPRDLATTAARYVALVDGLMSRRGLTGTTARREAIAKGGVDLAQFWETSLQNLKALLERPEGPVE